MTTWACQLHDHAVRIEWLVTESLLVFRWERRKLIMARTCCLTREHWYSYFSLFVDQCWEMAKGLIWATAEDLARNRGQVLSLYRQILRSLNSPNLPLTLAARLSKKAEAKAIFMLAAEEIPPQHRRPHGYWGVFSLPVAKRRNPQVHTIGELLIQLLWFDALSYPRLFLIDAFKSFLWDARCGHLKFCSCPSKSAWWW